MIDSLEIGFVLYCAALLFIYLFVVSKQEGQMLASFTRYLSDFVTGITIFVTLYVIYLFTSLQTKEVLHKELGLVTGFIVRNIVPLMLAFFVLITPVSEFTKAFLIPRAAASTSRSIRAGYNATENLEDILDKSTDRVFVVIQDDNSYYYWMSVYNLAPIRANPWNTWKVTATYDEWIAALKAGKYSYLFIVNVDSYFTDVFNELFIDGQAIPQTLYSIQYDHEKPMFLPAVFHD